MRTPDPVEKATQPKVRSVTVYDAQQNLVGTQQVVEGHVGDQFTVSRKRAPVMQSEFVMVTHEGAHQIAEANLTGVEADVLFTILGELRWENLVRLNLSEMERTTRHARRSIQLALERLRAHDIIRPMAARPGTCRTYWLNPSIAWKGTDRTARQSDIGRWDRHHPSAQPDPNATEPDTTDPDTTDGDVRPDADGSRST